MSEREAILSMRHLRRKRGGTYVEIIEYTHPFNVEESFVEPYESVLNAAETRLDALGLTPKQQFEYLFDFGDSWEHEIVVEIAGGKPTVGAKYPLLLEKRGESPPQYPDIEEDDEDE